MKAGDPMADFLGGMWLFAAFETLVWPWLGFDCRGTSWELVGGILAGFIHVLVSQSYDRRLAGYQEYSRAIRVQRFA